MARKKARRSTDKKTSGKSYLANAEKIEQEIREELAAENAKIEKREQKAVEEEAKKELPRPKIAFMVFTLLFLFACIAFFWWRANNGG